MPAKDADYYASKDVPHGQVRQRWYFSKVTGQWRRAYVYTPPDYDANTQREVSRAVSAARLGRGRDRAGTLQGHVDVIMDNLIAAEKKAKPMIIVMDNLNAVKPGESAALYAARGTLTQAVAEPPQPPARRHVPAAPAAPLVPRRDGGGPLASECSPR